MNKFHEKTHSIFNYFSEILISFQRIWMEPHSISTYFRENFILPEQISLKNLISSDLSRKPYHVNLLPYFISTRFSQNLIPFRHHFNTFQSKPHSILASFQFISVRTSCHITIFHSHFLLPVPFFTNVLIPTFSFQYKPLSIITRQANGTVHVGGVMGKIFDMFKEITNFTWVGSKFIPCDWWLVSWFLGGDVMIYYFYYFYGFIVLFFSFVVIVFSIDIIVFNIDIIVFNIIFVVFIIIVIDTIIIILI